MPGRKSILMLMLRSGIRFIEFRHAGSGRKGDIMLPENTAILVSYLNTLLRDQYDDPEDLFSSLMEDGKMITQKLAQEGYHYDPENHKYTQT